MFAEVMFAGGGYVCRGRLCSQGKVMFAEGGYVRRGRLCSHGEVMFKFNHLQINMYVVHFTYHGLLSVWNLM